MALRHVIAAVVDVNALAAVTKPAVAARTIEEPAYQVTSTHAGFEVRQYGPRIVAQVRIVGDAREASSAGFRVLAAYIFGGNRAKSSIAMTAPVGQQRAGQRIAMTAPAPQQRDGEEWLVTFTMPSTFTLATLPEPVDSRVELREIPGQRIAVWRFSGAPSAKVIEARKRELVDRVVGEGLTPVGAVDYARYDAPWVLPPLRRNELWVELAP